MTKDNLSDSGDLQTGLCIRTSKDRIYLSDVLDETAFKKGQANIIVAPCHSGKTTAALTKLVSLATHPEKVLFLIDTTAGKEALLKQKGTAKVTEEWFSDLKKHFSADWWGILCSGAGIRVMSYHQFGYNLLRRPDFLNTIEVVICDEMHNLLTYIGIERGKNQKLESQGFPSDPPTCQTALKEIARISNLNECVPLVIVMTATADRLCEKLENMKVNLARFDYTDKVTRDETKQTIYYNDIKAVLSSLAEDERAIIYVPFISMMREIFKAVDNGWRNICCLWSLHNAMYEMTPEQLAVRKAILTDKRIPSNIDILIINAAYETSINIENEDFQTMIIHDSCPDTIVQVRGRLRHDIDKLYLYDYEKKHIAEYLPEEYYDRFLSSADTTHIVNLLNLKDSKGKQKKWPSIVAALRENDVLAEAVKQKGIRGWILRRAS